ncbi:MAG TPA: hypothetical protein HPP83_05945, partial [Candidatus Hydrogenedentes bacterium]|nr:hypothetical protein [Candidatus Hydrogenedentota bacterium]
MPDQTYPQAVAKTHGAYTAHQEHSPTLISLAGDNRKVWVERNGAIRFAITDDFLLWTGKVPDYPCELKPKFGSGNEAGLERKLYEGWLPVPVVTVKENGVVYQERVFVAPYDNEYLAKGAPWLSKHALGGAEFTIENTTSEPADVSLELRFLADWNEKVPASLEKNALSLVAHKLGRLLISVDATESPMLDGEVKENTFILKGELPPRTSARCYAYIPTWDMRPDESPLLTGGENLLDDVEAYWRRLLAPAMQIDIPDPELENLIRASQVYCMICARHEDEGSRFAMWYGGILYGALEGDSHYGIIGLDSMGHHDFAQRCLDFFVNRYNPEGFLTMGYTLMGTGWHLWILSQHYELTNDRLWLEKISPEVTRVCRWIMEQREKTKKLDTHGNKVAEYGLMPPGVEADWNAFAYYFCFNGYFYAGLDGVGRALLDLEHPEAEAFVKSAEEHRQEILRAFHHAQAQAPVQPLRDGTWAPLYPSQVHCPAPTNDFFPGEDFNRTWCYDVEEGAHHLVAQGVLDPNSQDVTWMVDHMEDVHFLADGWFYYKAEESEKDPFNLGGFSKVQPYLTRLSQIYALRDDVKPFIRSYY